MTPIPSGEERAYPGGVHARPRRLRLPALLAPAVLIALAAHTALWGAWAPTDGEHAYFGWYAPLVTGAGAAGLVGLALLVAVAALGRRTPAAARLVRRLLPEPGVPLRLRAFQLSAACLRRRATPLLEEERHPTYHAKIANSGNPGRIWCTVIRARLTTSDHPFDPGQV